MHIITVLSFIAAFCPKWLQRIIHLAFFNVSEMPKTNNSVDNMLHNEKPASDSSGSSVQDLSIPAIDRQISAEPIDPWCLSDHPQVISFQDVSEANYKIRGGIERTPLQRSSGLSNLFGVDLWLKKDFLQVTGSFKERGARFALLKLSEKDKKKGVVAASAGNHALALAYQGKLLGIKATVVMPLNAPMMKISKCRQYGAEVIIFGHNMSECKTYAIQLAKQRELVYVNGYDHPHVLAGQGTAALEIVEELKDIHAIIVPVGGGGLIAGCAVAIKYLCPEIQIIGVESDCCASMSEALNTGKPTFVEPGATLADGLAVPQVGFNAFESAKHLIDKMVQVKETNIALAILRLVEMEKAVVEGAGATSVACLLSGQLPELKGKRVVSLICGGNIDTTTLGRCLERGLAADGRYCRFVVTVSDRPGGIADLTSLLKRLGVSIKDIFHDRAYLKMDIFSVRVKCVVETRDFDHCAELEEALRSQYKEVLFNLD